MRRVVSRDAARGPNLAFNVGALQDDGGRGFEASPSLGLLTPERSARASPRICKHTGAGKDRDEDTPTMVPVTVAPALAKNTSASEYEGTKHLRLTRCSPSTVTVAPTWKML